jgi:hypothetical protein
VLRQALNQSREMPCPAAMKPFFHEYPNITAALNAVLAKTDPVRFVAMSAICSSGSYTASGTSALAYFSIEVSSEPGTLVNNYKLLTKLALRFATVVQRPRIPN